MRRLLAIGALTAVTAVAGTPSAQQMVTHFEPSMAPAVAEASSAVEQAEAAGLDEMLRGAAGAARRWTRRPDLVVITSVLRFEGGVQKDYAATAGRLSDDEAAGIAADLTSGLSVLTGSAFDGFASVRFEAAAPGETVRVMREGWIVAGRFEGVRKALDAVGYGGRTARGDGTITSGTVILDNDYDRDDRHRRLLRFHELGHALGYNHVKSQRSIMNPTLGPEPTDFDRRVASIAFGTGG